MASRIGDRPRSGSRSNTESAIPAETIASDLAGRLIENLHHQQAKLPANATRNDWYMALAYTVRERVLDRVLAGIEVAVAPDQDSEDLRRQLAQQALDLRR